MFTHGEGFKVEKSGVGGKGGFNNIHPRNMLDTHCKLLFTKRMLYNVGCFSRKHANNIFSHNPFLFLLKCLNVKIGAWFKTGALLKITTHMFKTLDTVSVGGKVCGHNDQTAPTLLDVMDSTRLFTATGSPQ